MAKHFSVIPAAYVLLQREDGQVLLQLREGTGYLDGYWAFGAAGHVEEHESVLDGARREVQEELGVQVAAEDLVPLCVMHRTQGNKRAVDERVDFFFLCRRWQGEPTRREPDRTADLRWFDLDQLPHPVVSHENWVLERWHGGSLAPIVAYGF